MLEGAGKLESASVFVLSGGIPPAENYEPCEIDLLADDQFLLADSDLVLSAKRQNHSDAFEEVWVVLGVEQNVVDDFAGAWDILDCPVTLSAVDIVCRSKPHWPSLVTILSLRDQESR